MSSLTQAEMKVLKQAEEKARLAAQNKEAARVHLLAVQSYLARRAILPLKVGS